MLYEKIQLEDGEKVIGTVRKHWFVITIELIGSVVLALIPVALLTATTFLPELPRLTAAMSGQAPLITFGLTTWFLLNTIMGFTIWTHYYLDLWVITDRRIIVIDQRGFFNRKVSSFRLERLQDIKVTISGIIPTLLNFGTIRAQTAGANESNFSSSGMPDPRAVQALIQGAMDDRLKVLGNPSMSA
ncbi:PH domain-containing protein [Patescibacteria group bacterium]|nr:PH domain-containing protein [Patescibacteria group bacterium]